MELTDKIKTLLKKHNECIDEEDIKQFSKIILYLIDKQLVEQVMTNTRIDKNDNTLTLKTNYTIRFTGEEELLRLRLENKELRQDINDLKDKIYEMSYLANWSEK